MPSSSYKLLEKFLSANETVDFLTANLFDERVLDSLSWKYTSRYKEKTLKQVRTYQRLLKLVGSGKDQLIFSLMDAGIASAIQLAAKPKSQVIHQFESQFEEQGADIQQIYQKALKIRSDVLLAYMRAKQNNEPHARQSAITPN